MNLTTASSRDVRFLARFVKRAAKLLAMDASSAKVSRSFEDLLRDIREAIERFPDSQRALALEHMLKTSDLFGAKLFTCYDHPEIPPTNNALETGFRDTRRHERLITGHKSTARRTVREGPFLAPALQRARRGELPSLDDLFKVPEKTWRRNLQKIRDARARYDRPRRVRKNLKTLLEDFVKRCRELCPIRAP